MASHIYETKSLKPQTIHTAEFLVQAAQHQGYTLNEARRFAMHKVERSRQGDHIPMVASQFVGRKVTKQVQAHLDLLCPPASSARRNAYWVHGLGVYANEMLYERLVLKQPNPADDGYANVLHVLARIQRYAKPAVAERITAAIQNACNILPEYPEIPAYLCSVSNTPTRAQHAWASAKRGRDLFIEGLGSFDISTAAFLLSRYTKDIVSPYSIAAAGYCLAYNIPLVDPRGRTVWNYHAQGHVTLPYISNSYLQLERILKHPLTRAHLVRNRDFWLRGAAGIEHLDVLGQLTLPYGYGQDLTPSQIRQAMTEYLARPARVILDEAMQDLRVPRRRDLNPLPPPENIQFKWLQTPAWADISFNETVNCITQTYTFGPCRTSDELRAAAKDLHNCGASYFGSVRNGRTVILVCRDSKGKPVAMAQLDRGALRYTQASGPCNQALPTSLGNRLYNYAAHWSNAFKGDQQPASKDMLRRLRNELDELVIPAVDPHRIAVDPRRVAPAGRA